MKTSNQNDDRFTKDILLRQIFQEISEESKEESHISSVDDLIPTREKTSSKRGNSSKWIYILIFVIGLIYIWFYTLTEVTQSHKAPKTDPVVEQNKVTENLEISKEPFKNTHSIEESDTIRLIMETPVEIEDTRTEREKAKEALMMQMQN